MLAAAGPNPHDFHETKYFFTSYVAKFNKDYHTVDEFLSRMNIFWETGEQIRHHNAHHTSFILGHNYFSDLTQGEKAHFFGYHPIHDEKELQVARLTNNYENSVDWRAKGAVNDVRNQGPFCRADWAIATVSALESAHAIQS